MQFLKRFLIVFFIGIVAVGFTIVADAFVVRAIEVHGLQRISYGTVLTYLPIKSGQSFSADDSTAVLRALYKTDFFSDVRLARRGNTLIIHVVERPTIGNVYISGNKKLSKKKLLAALKAAGIEDGLVFDHSSLNTAKQAIQEQYYNVGRYNANISMATRKASRHRVDLNIRINEGHAAKIAGIHIIGNAHFTQREILTHFSLTTPNLLSFITHHDQYSRAKLQGDLERLKTFYMNRGYIRVHIDSTIVSITPNKRSIYITIHITEGQRYRVKGYRLTGHLLDHKATLTKMITIKSGEVFSRQEIIDTETKIGKYFASSGYADAKVHIIPEINRKTRKVFVKFDVQPGQRIYIRHITFAGNRRTADYVMRREMRLMEGSLYSLSKIQESRRRLNLLGYLKNVRITPKRVPGKPNQLDLNYHVKDKSSATANFNAGFSDVYGFLYGANVKENNFMGTGKQLGLGFNRSEYVQNYNIFYNNPYYTMSGISRGFNIYAEKTTPGRIRLSDYTTNVYGGNVTFGIPISERSRMSFIAAYQNTNINPQNDPSSQITNFINLHGRRFDQTTLSLSWSYNGYDRAVFPTRGFSQYLSGEGSFPVFGNSLDFYKFAYSAAYYHPITRGFILHFKGNLGYGNGYGNFKKLPFIENYYAGGINSVRGFEGNTLGPRDSKGDSIGGNILTTGSVGLIFPNLISKRLRTSVFVDVGNVFKDQVVLRDERVSAGLGIVWWSPFGPLQFSFAEAIHKKPGDDTKFIDFSVGTSF